MDTTEDLSARVLLKHILITEPPRTPVSRSAATESSTTATRRSSRLANKDAGGQTPQDILRRSLRHKLRESITRKSLPATKRRTTSFVHNKAATPAATSLLVDDGDTPRHILMNILRTEPVKSPVIHTKATEEEIEEPQPASANSSLASKHSNTELSGLDLSDITIGNAVSTAKGLSRKRPRRSFNITAFEKRLKGGDDVETETEKSLDEHSSLSLSSSTSLSLKTPFVEVRTEKRGLQRRVSNRRKITEEEFGAAVNKREMGGVSSFVERGHSDTAFSEGLTLGFSKLSEPDITADIVHCNTALYAQPEAMTSTFCIGPTQDKSTVLASQLQRQIMEVELREGEQKNSMYLFPAEEEEVAEPVDRERLTLSESENDGDAAEFEKVEKMSDGHPNVAATLKPVEEEGSAESQMGLKDCTVELEGEGRVEEQTERDAEDTQNNEDDEKQGFDPQPEDDDAAISQSDEEEAAPGSQSTEEEEEDAANSQTEELGAVDSQAEEHEDVAAYQSDQDNQTEGDVSNSQDEDERDAEMEQSGNPTPTQSEHDLEHISRRAHRSEGGVVPVADTTGGVVPESTEAELSLGKSKVDSAGDATSSLETGEQQQEPHNEIPDLAESSTQEQSDVIDTESADKAFGLHMSVEDSSHLNENLPEEVAAQDPPEQEEEEWEDDEDGEETEEVPSKTPAFVRQKRNLFYSDPQASPSVLKTIQPSNSTAQDLPAAKRKQARKKTQPRKREGGLPKSYLMSVFKHFAKTKVSADVYPVLKETYVTATPVAETERLYFMMFMVLFYGE
ncbi:uncharacterized protein V6R79_017719 [Siganus canaliculatus]